MTALRPRLPLRAAFTLAVLLAGAASAEPIPVAEVTREEPVMFERDILPMLRRNCGKGISSSRRAPRFSPAAIPARRSSPGRVTRVCCSHSPRIVAIR
jgi:hypothetical protein